MGEITCTFLKGISRNKFTKSSSSHIEQQYIYTGELGGAPGDVAYFVFSISKVA